jgi:hypothetical protein
MQPEKLLRVTGKVAVMNKYRVTCETNLVGKHSRIIGRPRPSHLSNELSVDSLSRFCKLINRDNDNLIYFDF